MATALLFDGEIIALPVPLALGSKSAAIEFTLERNVSFADEIVLW